MRYITFLVNLSLISTRNLSFAKLLPALGHKWRTVISTIDCGAILPSGSITVYFVGAVLFTANVKTLLNCLQIYLNTYNLILNNTTHRIQEHMVTVVHCNNIN